MEIVRVVRAAENESDRDRYYAWILEERKENVLQEPVVADAPKGVIPPSFRSGPVFAALIRDGFVEPQTGFAFTSDRRFVRESAMKGQLMDTVAARYDTIDFAAASPVADGRPRFVVSNQRAANYCRWWLDYVSKYYIFDEARRRFYPDLDDRTRCVSGELTSPFHEDTLRALGLFEQTDFPDAKLLRGDFYISSGLTFAGGQSISGKVTSFRRFVLDRLDATRGQTAAGETPRRFYISRAKTRMRRMLNEEEIDPILERHGFVKLALEDLSVARQIDLFRGADIIVSPHGAGLTNVIFCRPGACILEIFPEGGLHSSSFMRIASLSGLRYGYMCAEAVANIASEKNPGNADIICRPEAFATALSLVEAEAAPGRAQRRQGV